MPEKISVPDHLERVPDRCLDPVEDVDEEHCERGQELDERLHEELHARDDVPEDGGDVVPEADERGLVAGEPGTDLLDGPRHRAHELADRGHRAEHVALPAANAF